MVYRLLYKHYVCAIFCNFSVYLCTTSKRPWALSCPKQSRCAATCLSPRWHRPLAPAQLSAPNNLRGRSGRRPPSRDAAALPQLPLFLPLRPGAAACSSCCLGCVAISPRHPGNLLTPSWPSLVLHTLSSPPLVFPTPSRRPGGVNLPKLSTDRCCHTKVPQPAQR